MGVKSGMPSLIHYWLQRVRMWDGLFDIWNKNKTWFEAKEAARQSLTWHVKLYLYCCIRSFWINILYRVLYASCSFMKRPLCYNTDRDNVSLCRDLHHFVIVLYLIKYRKNFTFNKQNIFQGLKSMCSFFTIRSGKLLVRFKLPFRRACIHKMGIYALGFRL